MAALTHGTLAADLAKVLPSSHKFSFHHISSSPTSCPALYAAPLTQRPQKTYVESHFLTVSWKGDGQEHSRSEIAVFAIEILIFTTATLTTLFVSKADSTGYLSLLNLPRSSSSTLRSVSYIFTSHLVKQRHRPDRRLVVSLFARAQDQYLFPGSIENRFKHVLNDRQLVKWWCRTLDPLLREYVDVEEKDHSQDETAVVSKAYLEVPGHDRHETSAFFPPSARSDLADHKRWTAGHPLRDITPYSNASPRNQVPHFPDDPKNRFLMDLDEELQDVPASQQHKGESPSKRGTGQWKSVRTLEQFWEMMAFRQECSSGRLVSFLWIVFTPKSLLQSFKLDLKATPLPTPESSMRAQTPVIEEEGEQQQSHKSSKEKGTKLSRRKPKKPRVLSGPIIPRAPRVKSASNPSKQSALPETTRYYHSPLGSRGTLVLSHAAFNRVTDMLLRLDFANVDIARASTRKWADEVAIVAGEAGRDWGVEIIGTFKGSAPPSQDSTPASAANGINVLSVKKRKLEEPSDASAPEVRPVEGELTTEPRILDKGLIRKKPKASVDTFPSATATTPADQEMVQDLKINVLGANLVRKKPKA